MNNGKTKPENPGVGGRLKPGFGFEKSPGYPGFWVRAGLQTLVATILNVKRGRHQTKFKGSTSTCDRQKKKMQLLTFSSMKNSTVVFFY